jgi:membrane protease YdiL (CAAX protease family)
VVILVAQQVVGTVASALVAIAISGQEGLAAFTQRDYSAIGSVGGFLVLMAGFPFFLVGILIAVSLIHRRYPRTLITARERIDWHRVGQGFVAWFVPLCLVGGLGQYLFYPDSFSFTPNLATFALFVPLALVLTALQTTTEELFFRGYIVQGASTIWANRIFLALVSPVVFVVPHLLNPEAIAGGWLTIFLYYFVGGGLVLAVVSLVDGTTELAIGAHFANNIFGFLVVNAAGTVVTTPAFSRSARSTQPSKRYRCW